MGQPGGARVGEGSRRRLRPNLRIGGVGGMDEVTWEGATLVRAAEREGTGHSDTFPDRIQ